MKPTNLEYFGPAVTLAQWYTPPEEGIELANSAMQAATIQ